MRETLLNSTDHQNMFTGAPSFSRRNRLTRTLWKITWLLLARWTPPPFYHWRRLLLRLFGAQISNTARVYASAQIWLPSNLCMGPDAVMGPRVNCYNQAQITIGARTVLSQGCHLCTGTHDISDANFQLTTREITLEDRVWIAAEAFVGPGVRCKTGSVLGARAVSFHDLNANTVYRGNPAVPLKRRVMSDV